VSIKSARRAVSGPGWVNTKDARNSWARAKTVDLIAFQRPRLGEAREVVDDDLAFGVDPSAGQRGE